MLQETDGRLVEEAILTVDGTLEFRRHDAAAEMEGREFGPEPVVGATGGHPEPIPSSSKKATVLGGYWGVLVDDPRRPPSPAENVRRAAGGY